MRPGIAGFGPFKKDLVLRIKWYAALDVLFVANVSAAS